MPHRPLIGVACELEKHPQYEVKDKNVLNAVFTDAIVRAGGTPVIVPVSNERAHLTELCRRFDGIMLPGADDIPPTRYGCTPHPSEKPMPESQFEVWRDLLGFVLETGLPTFAICGGLQVINVTLGGSLTQDLPSMTESPVCHRNPTPPDATHAITVEPDSRLAAILGVTSTTVNSSHHQAIDRVGEGITITARCPDDNIVEAAEIRSHPFLVAVQWHPERYFEGDSSRRLFDAFVSACRPG